LGRKHGFSDDGGLTTWATRKVLILTWKLRLVRHFARATKLNCEIADVLDHYEAQALPSRTNSLSITRARFLGDEPPICVRLLPMAEDTEMIDPSTV
jgi:hypothetical protein